DGNPVFFELRNPQDRSLHRRDFERERDPAGHVSLKRSVRERSQEVGLLSRIVDYEILETTRFAPGVAAGPEIFDRKSIKLLPGTMIHDRVRNTTSRASDAEPGDVARSFDDIIGIMRSRGFAADPTRN